MKHTQRWIRWIGTLSMIVMLATLAFAQRQDGELRGTVTDASGAVVTGATVEVRNEATGLTRNTTSTSAGAYVFSNLPPGNYVVTVTAPQFRAWSAREVLVSSNRVNSLDAVLQVGGEGTTVEVTADAQAVQHESSDLSSAFQSETITSLPIPSLGGSPLELSIYAPNTTTAIGGITGDGGSVGGLRPQANSFNIDGVDNNAQDVTGAQFTPIPEAISEFSLVQNQFSAEYGFAGGGHFNIITKSGTNDLKGELHYFNRNRAFNAMSNLDEQAGRKPRVDYNRVGGTVGGPIVANRIFFFGGYEFQNLGLESQAPSAIAPTAAGLQTLLGIARNDAVRELLSQFPTAPAGNDTVNVTNPSTGAVVAVPVGTYIGAAPNFSRTHDYQANGDVSLASHQLRLRYLYNKFDSPNVNLTTPQSQFTGTVFARNHKVVLADVWSIRPTLLNDLRLSYSRASNGFTVPDEFLAFPQVTIDDLGLDVGPQQNSPQGGGQNVYQLIDNMTWTRGAHTWKWGGEYRRYISPNSFLPRSRGEWGYANLNELVNDYVPTGLNGALRGTGDPSFSLNQHAYSVFFQDDWKIVPRFTLNMGLRYEWTGNVAGAATQELNSIATLPGTFEFRKPKTDKNNFAPRLGFAWDPTGSGLWSVRGGAGISYYNTYANLVLLGAPPQLQGEQNPQLTCSGISGTPPAYCGDFNGGGPGAGFLANGGLLSAHLPPTTQEEARANTANYIVDQTQPKVMTWSLGVQRQVAKDGMVELRYLGTRALSLPVQRRLNFITVFEAAPELGSLPVYLNASEVPATVAAGGSTLADFENAQTLRYLDEGFLGPITSFTPSGSSTYHGGAIDFQHRFGRGLFLRTNYTFAKTTDTSTAELFSSRVNPRRPEDPYNIAGEYGRSALDIRHKYTLAWVYQLPKLAGDNGFLNALLNGYEFGGTFLAQSGQPITPLSGVDANGDFDAAGDRAMINPNGTEMRGSGVNMVVRNPTTGATSICSSGCDSALVVGYVAADPAARFIQAQLGARSTAGRNSVQTPGIGIWNMSIAKTTRLTEGSSLQFRLESYNTFNHRNFSLAVPTVFSVLDPGNALSTTYANVASTNFLNSRTFDGGARTLQLGVKVTF